MLLFVHRSGGVDRGSCASGQGGRAVSGSVIRCQTRPGDHCVRRYTSAAFVGLRVRVAGWRERRRERRCDRGDETFADGQRYRVHGERRPRPAAIVAGTGTGHGRGHGGGAAATGFGGQVVLPAQPHTGSTQRRDGHHQRQRAGVSVDSWRRTRGGRRARPPQRTNGRRYRRDATHGPVVLAPGHPGRAAHRRAHRRVQVSSGGLEL